MKDLVYSAPTISIVIPAAGSGKRFGGDIPKQYLELDGKPIIVHTLDLALTVPGVQSVVVAVLPSDKLLPDTLRRFSVDDPRLHVVLGGNTRMDSVFASLQHPSIKLSQVVLVHDAVRPRATVSLFENVASEALVKGAVVPCLELVDTIKRVENNTVIETVDRSELRSIQTPQGFQTDVLLDAYAKAIELGFFGTDDASVLEWAGHVVYCVNGESRNVKITTPQDLESVRHTS